MGIMDITKPTKELNPCSCLLKVSERTDTPEDHVITEPCPEPVNVYINGCEDTVELNAGTVALGSLGRILKLDVTIRSVCPHKRTALAVFLTEVDGKGREYNRGLKTLLIPAHTAEGCRDVTVRCIKFVLPEELKLSGESNGICSRRNFKVRLLANYIDTGDLCCTQVL